MRPDDLPDGLDALNRFRNDWSTDHDRRRRPKLREFDGLPDRRKRHDAGRRRQPRMLGTVARALGEIP